MTRISEFLKVAEVSFPGVPLWAPEGNISLTYALSSQQVGIDRGDIPDLSQVRHLPWSWPMTSFSLSLAPLLVPLLHLPGRTHSRPFAACNSARHRLPRHLASAWGPSVHVAHVASLNFPDFSLNTANKGVNSGCCESPPETKMLVVWVSLLEFGGCAFACEQVSDFPRISGTGIFGRGCFSSERTECYCLEGRGIRICAVHLMFLNRFFMVVF